MTMFNTTTILKTAKQRIFLLLIEENSLLSKM